MRSSIYVVITLITDNIDKPPNARLTDVDNKIMKYYYIRTFMIDNQHQPAFKWYKLLNKGPKVGRQVRSR